MQRSTAAAFYSSKKDRNTEATKPGRAGAMDQSVQIVHGGRETVTEEMI